MKRILLIILALSFVLTPYAQKTAQRKKTATSQNFFSLQPFWMLWDCSSLHYYGKSIKGTSCSFPD